MKEALRIETTINSRINTLKSLLEILLENKPNEQPRYDRIAEDVEKYKKKREQMN